MNTRSALAMAAVLAVTAAPALGQQTGGPAKEPAKEPAKGGVHAAASTPNLAGVWYHPMFPWFEPPASGPGPVTNRSRWPQQPSGAAGGILAPTKEGVSDYNQLVGDYTNPNLKPWAAEVVKKYGDMSLAGIVYPNPANQCWPEPMPFIYKEFFVQLTQLPDRVLFFYDGNHEIRRVRLNEPHPQPVTPSWNGDSVGHYEGDTLVIDTVGVKTDRPYAMIDLFGTPYSKSLHIVERYWVSDYDGVKDAIDRAWKENWMFAGNIFAKNQGKFLQVHVTIEDEGVFNAPWTSTLTYIPSPILFPEVVCAENPRSFGGMNVPTADKPDF
jgi:hypothetical protein